MRLIQHVDPDPAWPEFGYTADGRKIRLVEVEDTFPTGSDERGSVYYLKPDGVTRVYPWKEAGYYVDDEGQPIAPVGPAKLRMSRAELEGLGLTDARLDELHMHYLGREVGAPGLDPEAEDGPEMQERRRRFFDEAMRLAYAQTDVPQHGTGATYKPGKV